MFFLFLSFSNSRKNQHKTNQAILVFRHFFVKIVDRRESFPYLLMLLTQLLCAIPIRNVVFQGAKQIKQSKNQDIPKLFLQKVLTNRQQYGKMYSEKYERSQITCCFVSLLQKTAFYFIFVIIFIRCALLTT